MFNYNTQQQPQGSLLMQQIASMGGSPTHLQQSSMYNNMMNRDESAYSDAAGSNMSNTWVLPQIDNMGIGGMAYNTFARPMIEPMLTNFVSSRYDRMLMPTSNTPVNTYGVLNTNKKAEAYQAAGGLGSEIDGRRANDFVEGLNKRMNLGLGDSGMVRSVANSLGSTALNKLQGGSFSSLSATLARAADLEGNGAVSSSQINDLSKIIEETGFRNDGAISNNTSFTRGLGVDAIGVAVSELQTRGLFNFGTDVDTALMAGEHINAESTETLHKRRAKLEKRLSDAANKEDPAFRLTQEDYEKTTKELEINKRVAEMSPFERAAVFDTFKERQAETRMESDPKLTYDMAVKKTDSDLYDIYDGKNAEQLTTELRSGATNRLKKSVGGLLELVQTLGDVFETAAGDTPELLRRLDAIDSRALSTTSTADVANIVREARHTAEATGFSPTQLVATMKEASNKSLQYGLSFQEGQELAKSSMLNRAAFRAKGKQTGFGMPTGQELSQFQTDYEARSMASPAAAAMARFAAGYEISESLTIKHDKKDAQLYSAYKAGDATRVSELLGGDFQNITTTKSYSAATEFDGKKRRAEAPAAAKNFAMDLTKNYADEQISKEVASAISMNPAFEELRKDNVEAFPTLTNVIDYALDEADASHADVFTDPKREAAAIAVALGNLTEVVKLSDGDFKEYTSDLKEKAKTQNPAGRRKINKLIKVATDMRETMSTDESEQLLKGIDAKEVTLKHRYANEQAYGEDVIKVGTVADTSDSKERTKFALDSKRGSSLDKYFSDQGYTSTLSSNFINAIGAEKGNLLETALNTFAPHSKKQLDDVKGEGMKKLNDVLDGVDGATPENKELSKAIAGVSTSRGQSYDEYKKGLEPDLVVPREIYEEAAAAAEGVFNVEDVNNEIMATARKIETETYMDTLSSNKSTKEGFAAEYNKLSSDPDNVSAEDIESLAAKAVNVSGYDGEQIEKLIGKRGGSDMGDIVYRGIDDMFRTQKSLDDAYSEAVSDINELDQFGGDEESRYKRKQEVFDSLGLPRELLDKTYDMDNLTTDTLRDEHLKLSEESSNSAAMTTTGDGYGTGSPQSGAFSVTGELALVDSGGDTKIKFKDVKFLAGRN